MRRADRGKVRNIGKVDDKPVKSTPSFFEHSVKNRATFQRPATHARNIVYAYD